MPTTHQLPTGYEGDNVYSDHPLGQNPGGVPIIWTLARRVLITVGQITGEFGQPSTSRSPKLL
jgi:hypothetical protein